MSSAESMEPVRMRSSSRTRTSRPTTPLRPSSRSSFRDSARASNRDDNSFRLNTFEHGFAELSDAMADLEANMMHFQLMHESLARFSESFASFLYGLNMNAFCVDFPEGPVLDSFRRKQSSTSRVDDRQPEIEVDTTFMTNDTSFVDNPPTTTKATKFTAPERASRMPAPSSRTGTGRGRGGGRGVSQTGRPSALARPRGRGVR